MEMKPLAGPECIGYLIFFHAQKRGKKNQDKERDKIAIGG